MKRSIVLILTLFLLLTSTGFGVGFTNADVSDEKITFPRDLESYADDDLSAYFDVIAHRLKQEPFNAVATLIFFLAITHTMLVSLINKKAHQYEHNYEILKRQGLRDKNSSSMKASLFHLLGEVETVFGIWAIALAGAIIFYYDWSTFVTYINGLHYTEPLFVIVIMTIAASRPILKFFEIIMWRIVRLFGNSLEAWWICILILAPLLGSFVTEPAAMTISAFLLADKFYRLNPSTKFKYGTLALLFVNVSIGGVLTNFAAPPILMVAQPWGWDISYMMFTFGWKAILAMTLSTTVYYFVFREEFLALKKPYENYLFKKHVQKRFISQSELEDSFEQLERMVDRRVGYTKELDAYSFILKENIKELANQKLSEEERQKYDIDNAIEEKFEGIKQEEMQRTLPVLLPDDIRPTYINPNWDQRDERVPMWIIIMHVLFLIWTVFNAHEPVLFLSGFLFFLGFYQVTAFYQNKLDLKPALLVAFFLSGLMLHGSLQGWWIAPLLSSLPELALNGVGIVLTAFNDNASITYLSTLVSDLPEHLKYAIVSGAVTGGGLTVIANAPNPVGQSILKRFFNDNISPIQLLKFALIPTMITAAIFYFFK